MIHGQKNIKLSRVVYHICKQARYKRIINTLQWNGDKGHKWRTFIHNLGSRHRLENSHFTNQDEKGRGKSELRPVADICVGNTEYLGSTEIGNVWVKKGRPNKTQPRPLNLRFLLPMSYKVNSLCLIKHQTIMAYKKCILDGHNSWRWVVTKLGSETADFRRNSYPTNATLI